MRRVTWSRAPRCGPLPIRYEAAAAVLVAITIGCAPARPADPTLPVPLATALLNAPGMTTGPSREFTVGTVPPGFPAALVPPAPVAVVGGMRDGSGLVAVFADSTRRVAAVLEEHFERHGFTRPAATPGSGFMRGRGPSNWLCTDSAMVTVMPLTGDERHLARVTYRRTRGTSACAPSRTSLGASSGAADVRLELPELTAPADARARSSGGGAGGDEVNSRAVVSGSSLTLQALLAHYVAQLVAAGWTALPPAVGDGVAAQYLEATDAASTKWHGTLTVERSGDDARLTLRMYTGTAP